MNILAKKWWFWPPKWSKLYLKLFASSRHQKTIPITLKTLLLPLVIAYLQSSSLIVHLPISPQLSNFCVFQILIPEFDLTITSVSQHLQSSTNSYKTFFQLSWTQNFLLGLTVQRQYRQDPPGPSRTRRTRPVVLFKSWHSSIVGKNASLDLIRSFIKPRNSQGSCSLM